jgi:hypothetical protein
VALKIEGKERPFFADLRLREYRSVDNPHEVIDERSVSGSMEEVIEANRRNR